MDDAVHLKLESMRAVCWLQLSWLLVVVMVVPMVLDQNLPIKPSSSIYNFVADLDDGVNYHII